MNNTQLKALLASYGRSVLGAAVALYLSGVTEPGKLATALIAAVLPVAIRYFNPKDKAFGKLPKGEDLIPFTNGQPVIPESYAKVLSDISAKVVAEAAAAKKPAPKKKPVPTVPEVKPPVKRKPAGPLAPRAE